MPNRILRDWTDSESVNKLSVHAERLFIRLIMKVDDFGRFTANPALLRPLLFPLLLDQVREADLSRWLAECESAGLVRLYSATGKNWLEIHNFKQRTRQAQSKCPSPDGQLTVNRPSTAHGDGDGDGDVIPPTPQGEDDGESASSVVVTLPDAGVDVAKPGPVFIDFWRALSAWHQTIQGKALPDPAYSRTALRFWQEWETQPDVAWEGKTVPAVALLAVACERLQAEGERFWGDRGRNLAYPLACVRAMVGELLVGPAKKSKPGALTADRVQVNTLVKQQAAEQSSPAYREQQRRLHERMAEAELAKAANRGPPGAVLLADALKGVA